MATSLLLLGLCQINIRENKEPAFHIRSDTNGRSTPRPLQIVFFFCGNLCPWQQRAQAEGGFVWIGMIMAIGSPKHRLHPRWMTSPLIVPCSHEWKLPQLKRYCHSHDKKKRGVCRDLTLRLGTVLFSWDCLFLSLWLLLCSRLHIELLQECR